MNYLFLPLVKINAGLERLFNPSKRTIYLSIFRVFLGFHICKKLIFAWPYLGIVFGPGSFASWTNTPLWGLLSPEWVRGHYLALNVALFGAALCMMFGLGRRLGILAVFILLEMLHRTNGYCLDGGDNLLEFLLLYMMFCNSFDHLSLSRKQRKSERYVRLENLFTNLAVGCMIFHLCVVYFIAGLAKANSEVWYHGTALYYILQIERFCGTTWNQWLVQNPLFVTFGTYGSMLWELTFSFLIFQKRFRPYVIGYGIMMHIGIYTFMMINEFEVLFMMMYGFFFTNEEILGFLSRLKRLAGRRWPFGFGGAREHLETPLDPAIANERNA